MEHAHRLLEHREVLAGLLLIEFEGAVRREGAGELAAETLLLASERLQADLQVARHQLLDACAVEPDQLLQEGHRQQGLIAHAAFLVDDDLGQNRVGQVVPALGVEHDEIALVLDHGRKVVERHVGARLGIVEPPVGVLLDDDRLFFVRCGSRLVEHGDRHGWPVPWG